MGKNAAAFIAGLTFGLGLVVSQMINPAKVLGFLDVIGGWDPSLAFVMGGALIVTAIGYRLAWRRSKPLLAARFQIPGNQIIDRHLTAGAVLFGIGWGLVGLCPGPAIAALTVGGAPAFGFLIAMIAGMSAYEAYDQMRVKNDDDGGTFANKPQ